ncbi:MAG: hypothetical protein P4L84_20285 [Isosphaeraceae bacterium]|nr:hypothetical protein [Isosphaeraceae bacterium]
MSFRWQRLLGIALLFAWGVEAQGQSDTGARTGFGAADLRRAAAGWERQSGPQRQVVDQVCLVPDLATFLEVVGTWDQGHYFPVLIYDFELTFKFLREFRPARIVAYPAKAKPVAENDLWKAALRAVGRSWAPAGAGKDSPRGDSVPKELGETTPGVVLSAGDSPMLAGGVALAAGRFQPLLELKVEKHYTDVFKPSDANAFALQVERRVADAVPRYDRLGDGCDFLTLAGDWPYRYETEKGDNALDDLLGRFPDFQTRWAFTGRLAGDVTQSLYQAMCSLFLQPRSALLFNSYNEREKPWSDYRMTDASKALSALLPVTHRSGERASLTGWHDAFDPVNRFGLVLINTHGDPTRFNLPGGPGQSADVPPSVPTAVLMIHSFSAANPNDPNTIAGRWLAQGAFVYYGSMNEPYLQAFRSPATVGSLAAERLPLAAAVRQSPPETFGKPWRLTFVGDPLYRIDPRKIPRLASWAPVAGWPAYPEYEEPAADSPADVRLNWALKTAIFRLQASARPRVRTDLATVLLGIDRSQLPEKLRPSYDSLLADTLLESNRVGLLLGRLSAIPGAERSPQVRRLWETLVMNRLQRLTTHPDFPRAAELWSEVIASPAPADFQQLVTARIAGLANSKAQLGDWRQRLQKARRTARDAATIRTVEEELKRVEAKLAPPSTAR